MMHQCHSVLDNTLIAQLYQQYAPTIFLSVHRHITSREDAEDILLDVFIAALENSELPTFSAEKQKAWLLRVAHNKMVDYYRRVKRHPQVPLEEITETAYESEDQAPERVVLRDEEHALLRKHTTRLPVQQQEVLHLRYTIGLQHAEIAKRLNKREGAIRALLARAVDSLRKFYKQQ